MQTIFLMYSFKDFVCLYGDLPKYKLYFPIYLPGEEGALFEGCFTTVPEVFLILNEGS